MMAHQLRDGTYQCDKDGLTAEQYTAWQRENARAIAKGPGPFYPALKQRPDGFLAVEFVVDDDLIYFDVDDKCQLSFNGIKEKPNFIILARTPLLRAFNELCVGKVTSECRSYMVKVIGDNETPYEFHDVDEINSFRDYRAGFLLGGHKNWRSSNVGSLVEDKRSAEQILQAFKDAKTALVRAKTEDERIAATNILYKFWED